MTEQIKTNPGTADHPDPGDMASCLKKMLKEYRHLPSLSYFIRLVYRWEQKIAQGNFDEKIVVLGPGIPDELFAAMRVTPLWILGGSRQSILYSDDVMPRDAEPVSRSVLGYLNQACQKKPNEKLFIVPLSSDGMRKIAFQLIREGKKVCTVDIPPLYADESAFSKWKLQLEEMVEAVRKHTHCRISGSALREAVRQAVYARLRMREFLQIASDSEDRFSLSARIMIQNSYYYADDRKEWARRLHRLSKEIEGLESPSGRHLRKPERPGVLLMGSPVYFPNEKLPVLLEQSGLRVCRNIDCSTTVFDTIPRFSRAGDNLEKLFDIVSWAWFANDISPSRVINETLRAKIREIVKRESIDGVVFHVLKGQIEQDFELNYFEEFFESRNIPVFRLETDYHYQDVEQLRIRMEAFSEMLAQRAYSSADISASA